MRSNHHYGEHKLRWSLLLTLLVGLCSLSAPHLLGHAQAHHNSTGGTSRLSGASPRSRAGSGSADSEHESDQAHSPTTRDPHTFHIAASLVALVPTTAPSFDWIALGTVTPQDAPFASALPSSPHRGRAPPLA